MSTDPAQLQAAADTALEKAMAVKKYKLKDGTEVERPGVAELQGVREKLAHEAAMNDPNVGMFRPVAFGRPS